MRTRVAAARVARLATVTPVGAPHIVPCCFVLADDTVFTAVDGKPKSTRQLRRLANVRANPATTLLVDHYAADWAQLWWVRLDGTGRVVEVVEEQRDALTPLAAKYSQYRREPPAGPFLALDVTAWHRWPGP